jgi:hypothetical protein
VLKASFIRTVGQRDRIHVTRSDHSEASWVFPSYGAAPPHDLIHLVVESAFDVARGFWGRVDGGADPGAITVQANRRGGRDKYAAFGEDRSELQLAEALANPRWLAEETTAQELREQIAAGCRDLGVEVPALVSAERTAQVRVVLGRLARKWQALDPQGTIQLLFDPQAPLWSFERLWKDEAPARTSATAAPPKQRRAGPQRRR